MERGTTYALCHEYEYAFAKLVVEMVPGVDKVAFCNSGSEATLYALRIARTHTGRRKVAKFEGGYHGVHDFLAVSIASPRLRPAAAGPVEQPNTVPESVGLLDAAWQETITLPFNHPAAFDLLRRHRDEVAAVIIEPVQGGGGCIPATPEFLRELRAVTREIGAVLIFDEVITGFRLAPGGAQEVYGVTPDLTTFGKVLGGGMPIGAIGGSEEMMRHMAYDEDFAGTILFGGTFNGNPITVAAGHATLQYLWDHKEEAYGRLNAMGERIRTELAEFCQEHDIPACPTGMGSLFWLHGVEGPVESVRDLRGENRQAATAQRLLFRLNGLLTSAAPHAFLSTAHTDQEIDFVIDVHKGAMRQIREMGLW